jgi:hypothetical protein
MLRGHFLRSTQPISGVSSLIAVSWTDCSLLVLRQIETHIASETFLPTHPFTSFLTHQLNDIAFFCLSFCSTFFMLCFQNSQPFLGLCFRLFYIRCLYVYYNQIANCLQYCRYFFWLYQYNNMCLSTVIICFIRINHQISSTICFYFVKQKYSLLTGRFLDLMQSDKVLWGSTYF